MSVRLKDIAAHCGVSATLVSAVLNRRQGRIGCSAALRSRILDVASRLDYHPNRLARSMVSRRSPMVGVMLNITSVELDSGYHNYFNRVFPALTFQLNERNLEVLFVPFHDEQGQLARLTRLYREGLIGGVITNLIPRRYQQIAKRLTELNLPYMILGYPQGFDCHCVFSIDRYEWLPEFQKKHSFRRSFLLIPHRGKSQLLEMPFPDDYYWLAEPLALTDELLLDADNLIICSGASLYNRLPLPPRNAVIIEEERLSHQLPDNVPAVIVSEGRRNEIVSLAARNLADWMQNDKEPEQRKNQIFSNRLDLELRF
jgi:hypothetical protein